MLGFINGLNNFSEFTKRQKQKLCIGIENTCDLKTTKCKESLFHMTGQVVVNLYMQHHVTRYRSPYPNINGKTFQSFFKEITVLRTLSK